MKSIMSVHCPLSFMA